MNKYDNLYYYLKDLSQLGHLLSDIRVVLYTLGIVALITSVSIVCVFLYTKSNIKKSGQVPDRKSVYREMFTVRIMSGRPLFYVHPILAFLFMVSILFLPIALIVNDRLEYADWSQDTMRVVGDQTIQTKKIQVDLADEILCDIRNTSPTQPLQYEIRCTVPKPTNSRDKKFTYSIPGEYGIEYYKIIKIGNLKPHESLRYKKAAVKDGLPRPTYKCSIVLKGDRKGQGTARIERIEHPMPW